MLPPNSTNESQRNKKTFYSAVQVEEDYSEFKQSFGPTTMDNKMEREMLHKKRISRALERSKIATEDGHNIHD
jgi:hypothetical protein